MMVDIEELEVVKTLTQAVNVKYVFRTVFSVVLLLYDTVINGADEVNYIWCQRWSVGKVLYIVTRYGCFFDVIAVLWYNFSSSLSIESCRVLYEITNWSMTVGVILCQVVFIIRAFAIWQRSLFILGYLCLIQAIAVIISIVELNLSNKSVTFVPSPSPTVASCLPILGNNKLFICFCIVMVVELNILCLSLAKGFFQWRNESTPFVRTLYRDGVIYFAVLFSVSMTNLIIVVKEFNTPYFYIVAEPQRVLHSIIASRVIINVRKAFYDNEVTSTKVIERFRDRDRLAESIAFAANTNVTSRVESSYYYQCTDVAQS